MNSSLNPTKGNTPKPRIGQTYKRVAPTRRHFDKGVNIITVTFVGEDYFTYMEDPNQYIWTFDLLSNEYELMENK